MRKSLVTLVLAGVFVVIAAFSLSGLASAADRLDRSEKTIALSAPQATATPTATITAPKSAKTPTPARRAPIPVRKATATIPAPKLRDYQNPIFSWTWNGVKQMGKLDWYFDIQVYQATAQDPYYVIVAEPTQTKLENGFYSYNGTVNAECNSFWVVQIAKRVKGRFTGWVSPKSDRLPIGGSCGGGGGSKPAPPPQPTICPGNCP
jgi:hypothetical protein